MSVQNKGDAALDFWEWQLAPCPEGEHIPHWIFVRKRETNQSCKVSLTSVTSNASAEVMCSSSNCMMIATEKLSSGSSWSICRASICPPTRCSMLHCNPCRQVATETTAQISAKGVYPIQGDVCCSNCQC